MESTGTLSLVFYLTFIAITLIALAAAFYQVIKGKLPKEKLDILVELFKYGVVTMAITTVGTIISDQFKERDQDIKELDYFHKYVEHAIKLNGHERLQLSKFLATVAPKGPMRDAWKNYYDTVRVESDSINIYEQAIGAINKADSSKIRIKPSVASMMQKIENFYNPLIPLQPEPLANSAKKSFSSAEKETLNLPFTNQNLQSIYSTYEKNGSLPSDDIFWKVRINRFSDDYDWMEVVQDGHVMRLVFTSSEQSRLAKGLSKNEIVLISARVNVEVTKSKNQIYIYFDLINLWRL